MTVSLEQIVERLNLHGVRYILIGGWAAAIHGSSRSTVDVDFVYARDTENMQQLVEALQGCHPYPRDAPPGLPFQWSVETLKLGLNFTLSTDLGDLDFFGEVPGGGNYQQLLPDSIVVRARGVECRVVSLERLIALKHASGRAKDFEAIAELQTLLKRQRDK